MLVLDNGDAIRGIAEVATQLDFIVNGYVGTTATQLADGQLGSTEGDLYLSGADGIVVTSISITNTDSAARTFTLYLKPSGGTSRAISPVSLDLGVGHSFKIDGQRTVVMDKSGNILSTVTAASHALGGATHDADTLSNLNAKISDATLVDTDSIVLKALFDANTILAANSDNTPVAITLAASRILGRKSSGNIVALTATELRTIINVANGATAYVDADAVSAIEAAGLTFAENRGIILDALLSGDEKWSGITELGTMGYGATVGDLIYLNVTDTKWELTDADAEATAFGKLGLVTATVSEDATTQVLLYGKMRSAAFPAFTVGAPVHVGVTAGDVQVAAPTGTADIVRIIGYGNTAEDLFFCPDNTYIKLA